MLLELAAAADPPRRLVELPEAAGVPVLIALIDEFTSDTCPEFKFFALSDAYEVNVLASNTEVRRPAELLLTPEVILCFVLRLEPMGVKCLDRDLLLVLELMNLGLLQFNC